VSHFPEPEATSSNQQLTTQNPSTQFHSDKLKREKQQHLSLSVAGRRKCLAGLSLLLIIILSINLLINQPTVPALVKLTSSDEGLLWRIV